MIGVAHANPLQVIIRTAVAQWIRIAAVWVAALLWIIVRRTAVVSVTRDIKIRTASPLRLGRRKIVRGVCPTQRIDLVLGWRSGEGHDLSDERIDPPITYR